MVTRGEAPKRQGLGAGAQTAQAVSGPKSSKVDLPMGTARRAMDLPSLLPVGQDPLPLPSFRESLSPAPLQVPPIPPPPPLSLPAAPVLTQSAAQAAVLVPAQDLLAQWAAAEAAVVPTAAPLTSLVSAAIAAAAAAPLQATARAGAAAAALSPAATLALALTASPTEAVEQAERLQRDLAAAWADISAYVNATLQPGRFVVHVCPPACVCSGAQVLCIVPRSPGGGPGPCARPPRHQHAPPRARRFTDVAVGLAPKLQAIYTAAGDDIVTVLTAGVTAALRTALPRAVATATRIARSDVEAALPRVVPEALRPLGLALAEIRAEAANLTTDGDASAAVVAIQAAWPRVAQALAAPAALEGLLTGITDGLRSALPIGLEGPLAEALRRATRDAAVSVREAAVRMAEQLRAAVAEVASAAAQDALLGRLEVALEALPPAHDRQTVCPRVPRRGWRRGDRSGTSRASFAQAQARTVMSFPWYHICVDD